MSRVVACWVMLGLTVAPFAAAQEPAWVTQATDLYPSLSPDGQRLVFHSNRLGRPQLFLADAEGGHLAVLPSAEARITPVWSPDGRQIAFVGIVEAQTDIFVMDGNGENVRRLTDHPGTDIHPHWTSDGSRLFFNSDRTTPATAAAGSVHDVFSVGADGGDLRRHTDCRGVCTYPVPSPDGRQIVYRRELARPGFDWDLGTSTTDSEVVVANVDGSEERNLSNNAAFDGWPTWSPDGRWIAFASNRAGPANVGQIYLVRPDGGSPVRLTNGPWSHAQPSFAPDGRSLFVFRLQEGTDFQFGFIARVPIPSES